MDGWVGGAAGEMKNKAKLSLNLVWAWALAELGNFQSLSRESCTSSKVLSIDLILLRVMNEVPT